MKKHFRITVSGKVQGVGFRRSGHTNASKYKLTGVVRNTSDGHVVFDVEGTDPALEQFVAWCRKGPVMARVADVHVEEGQLVGLSGFHVAE